MATRREIEAGRANVTIALRDRLDKGLRLAQRKLDSFGRSLTNVGSKLLGLSLAAAAPFAVAGRIYANFSDQISLVRAVTQATDQEFQRLSDSAKELGRTTSFTASQVAALQVELGRAGFKPDEIVDATGAVLDLARATGTDASVAAGILASSLRQFGLAAKDATAVADTLTAGANKSFNTLETIGEALTYAGTAAADSNTSLQETVAILGALGNVGIQGSAAGTALRRLLVLSSAESQNFAKIFGVATKDANGNARKLIDVLGDIDKATANLGSADRAQKFNEAFGLLGITAASALSKGTTGVLELQKELEKAGGIARNTARAMDDNLGGAFRILLSAAEGIAIAVGEAIEQPVRRAAEAFTGLAGVVTAIVKNNGDLVRKLLLTVAIVGAVGAAMVTLGVTFIGAAAAIGGVVTIIGGVTGALGTLLSIVASVAPAMAVAGVAVVALGYSFGITFDNIKEGVVDLLDRIKRIGSVAIETFKGVADALAAGDLALAGKVALAGLQLAFQEGLDYLKGRWQSFQDYLQRAAIETFYGASSIAVDGLSGIATAFVNLRAGAKSFFADFANRANETFNLVRLLGEKAANAARGALDNTFDVGAANQTAENQFVERQFAAQRKLKEREAAAERERDKQLRDIDSATQEAQAKLAAQLDESLRIQSANSDADKRKAAEQLAKARSDFEAAVASAEAAREKNATDIGDAGDSIADKLKAALAGLDVAGAVGAGAGRAFGAFSSQQVAAFNTARAPTRMERILEAIERRAARQEEYLARIAAKNNGVTT